MVNSPPTIIDDVTCQACQKPYVFRPGIGVGLEASCGCASGRTPKWDQRFLKLAELFASWSKDPSTKVGCVIVGPDREIRTTGFNGFPRGVSDDARLEDREKKYSIIVHAEANAIYNANLTGVSLKGCASYTYPWPSCIRCAGSLIQAGISEVVSPIREIPERWKADFEASRELLLEAGIRVRTVQEVP